MTSRLSFAHRLRAVMHRGFAPYRRLPPGQVELSGMRVLQQLRKDPMWDAEAPQMASATSDSRSWSRIAVPLAAAAVLVLAVGVAVMWPRSDAPLYRVVEGDVRVGDPPSRLRSFGETGTIRSNGSNAGAVLALTDGSRIEMRSHSELSLERADDGVRIHLASGGIIVNAATQRSGHLYVQTKDMAVSVVGTVFVVNADKEGSRVAVIEGEVRVQQGATETKLHPGEGVASSPKTETLSVASELAWSRRAKSLIALMERQNTARIPTTAAAQAPAIQAPKEPRVAFEVVSIRSAAAAPPPSQGARGGGGGLNSRPAPSGCVFGSFGYSLQLDPRRIAVNRTTLLHLAAYTMPIEALQGAGGRRIDLRCDVLTKVGLLSGGPDWIRTDVWDVAASIPEGTFSSSPDLTNPVLQQMLRTMLSERFGFVVRRETRDIPVYLLKVRSDGPKFNGVSPRATNRDPNRGPVAMLIGPDGKPKSAADLPPPPDGAITNIGGVRFGARNVTMQFWANYLFGIDGRPVLDRTGLTGRYDFYYENPAGRPRGVGLTPDVTSLDRDVIKAMGFELEESTAPFDAWVIERAEKPSEN
jgi:uncharacterized protein (TIGR03435 family)